MQEELVIAALGALFASLVGAGIIGLFKLNGLIRAMQMEICTRFSQNDSDHKEMKSRLEVFRKESREFEKDVDRRIMRMRWSDSYGHDA
jgi:hypothetical protein